MTVIVERSQSLILTYGRSTPTIAVQVLAPKVIAVSSAPPRIEITQDRVRMVQVGIQGPQGQRGVAGPPTAAPLISKINADTLDFTIGMPVYVFSGTGAKRALANDINTKRVVGLVVDTIIPTLGSGSIQTDGTLTATTAEWDFLTGDVNGLAPNAPYFLDPITPGRLTRTAPSTLGYFICPIGTASNATDMIINLGPTIGI